MAQTEEIVPSVCLTASSPFTPSASECQASTLCQISLKTPHGVSEEAKRPQADGAEGQAWGAVILDDSSTGPPPTLTGVWPRLETWQPRLRCPVIFKECLVDLVDLRASCLHQGRTPADGSMLQRLVLCLRTTAAGLEGVLRIWGDGGEAEVGARA